MGLLSNKAITGKYGQYATKYAWAALGFRTGAFAFMLGTIGGLIWLLKHIFTHDFIWYEFVLRFTIVTAFGILAMYCINEANKYFSLSNRHRQAELELTAIDPYLATLPEEDVNEIKKHLVEKYFGNFNSTILPTDTPI